MQPLQTTNNNNNGSICNNNADNDTLLQDVEKANFDDSSAALTGLSQSVMLFTFSEESLRSQIN